MLAQKQRRHCERNAGHHEGQKRIAVFQQHREIRRNRTRHANAEEVSRDRHCHAATGLLRRNSLGQQHQRRHTQHRGTNHPDKYGSQQHPRLCALRNPRQQHEHRAGSQHRCGQPVASLAHQLIAAIKPNTSHDIGNGEQQLIGNQHPRQPRDIDARLPEEAGQKNDVHRPPEGEEQLHECQTPEHAGCLVSRS